MSALSVLIPSKNRPKQLIDLLSDIHKQTHLPDEVVICDQSAASLSAIIEEKFSHQAKPKIFYYHEAEISGLVEARKYCVKNMSCTSNYCLFFDDDIHISNTFIESIVQDMSDEYVAVVGNFNRVTTTLEFSFSARLRSLFYIGYFYDNRWNANADILSVASGGLVLWRAEHLRQHIYKVPNALFYFEDIVTSRILVQATSLKIKRCKKAIASDLQLNERVEKSYETACIREIDLIGQIFTAEVSWLHLNIIKLYFRLTRLKRTLLSGHATEGGVR